MDPTRSNSRPNAQPEDLNCSTSDNKEGPTGTYDTPAAREHTLNDTRMGNRWGNVEDQTKDRFLELSLVLQSNTGNLTLFPYSII